MKKKLITLILCASSCGLLHASEYQTSGGIIHTVTVTKGWCGNLGISTLVGKIVDGKCAYEKETQPYGYTGCTQYLNGGLLEMKVGRGYTCAASRIHSNVFGGEVLDEFKLISDNEGHYASSDPEYSEVELPK